MSQFYTSSDNFVLIPAQLMVLFGCAALLFDFLVFDYPFWRKLRPTLVVAAEIIIGWSLWRQKDWLATNGLQNLSGLSGAVTIDGFSLFFNWIVVVATAAFLVVLLAGGAVTAWQAVRLARAERDQREGQSNNEPPHPHAPARGNWGTR